MRSVFNSNALSSLLQGHFTTQYQHTTEEKLKCRSFNLQFNTFQANKAIPYEVLDNGKYLEGGRGAPQVMIIQLNSNQLHLHFGS